MYETEKTTNKLYVGLLSETIKTLDPEFLPEHLQFGEVTEKEILLENCALNVADLSTDYRMQK